MKFYMHNFKVFCCHDFDSEKVDLSSPRWALLGCAFRFIDQLSFI